MLNIHTNIKEKLDYFHKIHKIPNIIFHGQSGCGKKTILNDFIHTIYGGNKDYIKSFVMYVNCAHCKGIKFIRDELKFFSKTQINSDGGDIFKSIVLLNADKLTMDAQSALRRCIELFNHNTRFFIIVEDKYKLLKPILSRFCEIYVPEPLPVQNLYTYNISQSFKTTTTRIDNLKKELSKFSPNEIFSISNKLYEKGYSGVDLMNLLEKSSNLKIGNVLTEEKRYELLFTFNKIRKEFRNEKLLIAFILNFLFLSLEYNLENISFM
jgi:DNA polymerase III delta prime subunit